MTQAVGPSTGAAPATAEIQRDAETVREFAQLLQRSGDTIARAFYCGAAVGRAARTATTPADRLLAGLRAMADRLGFAVATEGIVRERVGALTDIVAKRFSDAGPPPPPLTLTLDSTEAWQRSVSGASATAGLPPLDENELRATIDRAAQVWAQRFLGSHPDQSVSAKPGLDDVLCAAAGARLTSILRPTISEMTLKDWGDALYWSVRSVVGDARDLDVCSAWLGVVALVQIGQKSRGALLVSTYDSFSDMIPSEWHAQIPGEQPRLMEQRRFQDETEMARRLLGGASPTGYSGDSGEMIVIVRHPESSITAPWRQGLHGALSLTEDQLKYLDSRLVQPLRGISTGDPSFIFEWPFSVEPLLGWIGEAAERRSFIIASDRVPGPLPLPVVVAPKNMDDALTRGRAALSRPPWSVGGLLRETAQVAPAPQGVPISRLVQKRKKKK